jgi:hypothetical protein
VSARRLRTRTGALVSLWFVIGLGATAQAATLEVTSSRDEGPGTLRAAIEAANESPGSRIVTRLGADVEIVVESALPPITAAGTRLDGAGVTLREGAGCRREAGQRGCDGLVVRAADVVVRHVRVAGFTFDGIAVRGRAAQRVLLESLEAIDNLDDGIGVSEGASDVRVVDSLLMGNGFRTKGKGLLVFDDARAALTDSVVLANRDGITVSRGGRATLERVMVAGNFDKGIGVSAASLEGAKVQVLGNGIASEARGAVPNADGLRVGLEGSAGLVDCRVGGNGDAGVVVLDRSRVTLQRCDVSGNRGPQTRAAPQATLVSR